MPRISLLTILLSRAVAVAVSRAAAVVFPVTSPGLAFSRYNWALSDVAAVTSNPGASIKFAFSQSSSVSMLLDTTNSTTPSCVLLLSSVDDGPWTFATPEPGIPNASVALATGLALESPHDVRVHLYTSCSNHDRWLLKPAAVGGNSFLVITGVALDDGAALLPVPPFMHAGTALVYGDSISEGANGHNYNWDRGSCGGALGLANSASVDTWSFATAEALSVEVSLVAFAAQGYATKNSLNYGNVPPLLTVGSDALSSWKQVHSGVSRLAELATTPPTYVFNALGFNDQNNDVTPAALSATVAAWLSDMRGAVGGNTSVFVVVPFGGEMRTANVTRLAILAGVAAYTASAAGSGDPCTFLLDLYPRAQRGLQGFGRPTFESCEGTHPLAARHGQLGAMVAVEATRILLAASPTCSSTVTAVGGRGASQL